MAAETEGGIQSGGMPRGGRATTHRPRRGRADRKMLPGGRCWTNGCRERLFTVELSYDPPRPDTAVFVIRAPHTVSAAKTGATITLTGKAGAGYVSSQTNVELLPKNLYVVCRNGHRTTVKVDALQNLTRAMLGT